MIPSFKSIAFGYVLMLLFQTEMKVGMSENKRTWFVPPESREIMGELEQPKMQWQWWIKPEVLQVKIKIQTKTGELTSNGVHLNEAPYNGNVWVYIECEVK